MSEPEASSAASPRATYEELRGRGPVAFVEGTGRRRYWELLTEARQSLRDPATGAARAELVEHVRCAACGNDRPYGGFVKDGFSYVRCRRCGTVYVNPQLTEEATMSFWTTSLVAEAWAEVLRHPAQLEFDEAKYRRGLDLLAGAGVVRGRLLDVGAGIGLFLNVARQRGFDVSGTEPGPGGRRTGRELFGLELHAALEEVGDAPFDAISAWEVVEHTKDPLGFLQSLRGRVAPEGRALFLVGGNAASLANRMMRAASAAFDFARPWYFTPDSFSLLLERAGWVSERLDGVLDELDVATAYLGYGDPYQAPGYVEEVLPARLVEELRRHSLAAGMAYKFLVVAAPK